MPRTAPPRDRVAHREPLGFKVELTRTQQKAEHVAKLKEEVEDKQESLARALEQLLDQMRQDKVSSLKARAPGGTVYQMDAVNRGEVVKVTKSQA